jgi:predicted metalloendopeptidase
MSKNVTTGVRRRAGCRAAPWAFAALSAWAVAASAQGADAASLPAVEAGVDSRVQPGDDFFAYANGGWLEATRLPAARARWGARNEIDEITRRQIETLLDDAASAPAGSLARQVADFRAAYLDEAAIEARGLAPLQPLLGRIARVRDQAGLTRLLGREMPADVDPLNRGVYDSSHVLGLSVEPGLHGEKTQVAFLLQGGLGLPDRDAYLSEAPGAQARRTRYQACMGRLLELSGFDHGAQRAQAVMALETALAQSHATPEASAEDSNSDHLWTRADFSRQAPGMNWKAFFDAAGLARQPTFVVWQPSAVKGVASLVASQPLQAWKDYLRVRAVDRHADVLPRAFAEAALASCGAEGPGSASPESRAQRASRVTQQVMSDAIGRLYAERHFPPGNRARVQAIAANVIAAFDQRIEALTWMSAGTRQVARAKLKALYFGVGYPERWQDDAGLIIDRADALGNLQRISQRDRRRALARLGQQVDLHAWWIAPQTVGALLVFQQNAYNFPAALLQAPKFDPAASDAANYGAIGAIVGHEVSHFLDTLGAEYGADGRLQHWWTAEDSARFQASTQALADQYAAYHPLPGLAIDGQRTLVENVADLGGLAEAFDAYRRTLGSRGGDSAYVRQQDRQFFIGFARSWRSQASEDGMRKQVASDSHAPDRYRIATVRNIDAWYDAFDVRPGQRLYLEPKARVRIW